MVVKKLLGWSDKKYEEALNEDGAKSAAKAFISACVEGAVEMFFGVGVMFMIIGIWTGIKSQKK